MSKVGNYIVGASVVAVMAGNPDVAEAQNVVSGEQENKIEGQSKEELKENLAKIHPKKENVKESKNENNNDKVVQAMMMKQRSER